MRFNSLSEIIAGLEVDENCQALVRWGVTSATCLIPNRHMIQFTELETTDALPPPSLTAVITGSCDKIYNGPSGIISPQLLSDDNSKETRDTIFQPVNATDCYNAGVQPPTTSDTVEYTISCKDSLSGYNCNYSFELNGMPAGSECKYYVNGMLIDSIIHDANVSDNSWLFPLDRQYFISDSAVNVKIIIDGIEYNLKIFAEDNTIDLAERFAQLPNIQLDTDLRGATLMLDENTLVQSIQLPNLPGCSYNLGEYYSHAPFTIYPNIDDNNILTFELDSHACRAEFDIKTQCECDGNFTFRIENPDCVEYACEEIFFDGHVNSSHNDTTAGEAPRMPTTPGAPRFFNHSITAGSVLGSNITTITVDEISTTNSMTDSITKISHHEVYDVSVSFPQGWSSKIVSYKICVTLDNGVTCCDTFECVMPGTLDGATPCNEMDVTMNSDKREALYILDPGLINTPPVPPLYIALYDEWGYLYRVLHNNIPVSSEGTIYYGDLPARLYNIVFWWGKYIKTIPILGSGVGTGGETNINPNK